MFLVTAVLTLTLIMATKTRINLLLETLKLGLRFVIYDKGRMSQSTYGIWTLIQQSTMQNQEL
jgi:hypothetical protein